MLATLTAPGSFVKITQDLPLKWVSKLTGWTEEYTGSGVVKREFRWGITNKVRASWILLTEENLQKIVLNPNDDIFVDFRITFLSGGPYILSSINVTYTQIETVNSKDPFFGYSPAYTVSENGNLSNLIKIENFTFDPYATNPAVVLYKDLSYTINQMFGHEVFYARTVPMAIGKDVTLHEWTLYDVDDPKCIKLLVPNNEFPDTKIMFNPMGLDFEMPFEVHIDKNYFEQIFGVGTAPQKRDIVYMPIANRIYEIESTYLFNDFMLQPAYWKIALKKYSPKSNRYESTDLREAFDTLTHDTIERFGDDVIDDAEKTTNPKQFDQKLGSTKYDPVRLAVNKNLKVIRKNVLNYTNILSETQYDLRSVHDITLNSNQETAIEYREKNKFKSTDDISFTAWFSPVKSNSVVYKDQIKGYLTLGATVLGYNDITFIISVKRNYEIGSLVKVTRFNGLNLYGEIVSITPSSSNYIYVIKVDNKIIKHINTYYPNWASISSSTGYMLEPMTEDTLITGFSNNAGWEVKLYSKRYIRFTDKNASYLFILNKDLLDDNWYAIFLNASNFYKQISLNLWVRQWNESTSLPATTTLENLYTNTIIDFETIDRSVDDIYKLKGSNLLLTNIRLYDKIETETDKQILMLNQTIVKDAQFSVIIDNALELHHLPWIASTK